MSIAAMGIAAIAAGCGDNFQNRDCATGTKPDPSGVNQCVPDGSVICGQGTVFNMDSGKCDPSADECPDGTILVNNECVTSAKPDAEENPEPNDTDGAGAIILPDVGKPGFLVHGCITPRDDGSTADNDPWFVTVDKPTLLEITADGVGGLSAGFDVQPADEALAALTANGWVRFGINLTGDTSKRQVYLPAAGSYALVLADSRQLFLQEAVAGSDKTCYFTTVTQLAIPTPTALTAGKTTLGSEVKFYTLTKQEGDFADIVADVPSQAANGSVVVVKNGAYASSKEEGTDPLSGAPAPAEAVAGGLKVSDDLVIAVDSTYNYALAPVPVTIALTQLHASALPANGTVTTTEDATYFTFTYFDVANAGDLVHFDLAFADPSVLRITDSSLNIIADVTGSSPIPSFADWVRFPAAGRYYALLYHPSLTAGTTTVTTSKLVAASPAVLAVGTPVTNKALGDLHTAWFSFDPSAQTWIKISAGGTNFGGNVQVTFYPADGVGRPDTEITAALGPFEFNPSGTQSQSRITYGDPSKYLVRVDDAGAPNAAATFNLSAVDETFTNLGMVTEAKPANKAGEDLGGVGKTKLYFLRGHAGDTMTITIHPTAGTFNPSLARLDVSALPGAPINGGGAGADESVKININSLGWVAFAVTGAGATTTYDVSVTAVEPIPYTQTSGTLAFTDVCNSGANEVTLSDPDEGFSDPITMPWAFGLFGDDVTEFTVGSNGFVAFQPVTVPVTYNNVPIPTEGEPDGFVAPYWSDLTDMVVCMQQDAEKVVIQWTGAEYGLFGPGRPVQFQTIMHKSGVIDFVYGSGQVADGDPATVGVENVYGTFGKQSSFNTAASVKASTSVTLTPVP
jgi:hypothetical protein